MTRVSPRTNFHSSKLIRCLAELAIVDAVDPGNAFAEQLGLWIHFTDAITLSAVHNDSIADLPKTQPKMPHEGQVGQVGALAAAGAEFDRIQAVLMNSIIK